MADAAQDEELARRAAGGDSEAFGELVRRHQDRLYTLAYRLVWNEQDAADCVQDALFSAWRAIGRYRGEAQVSTWLHQIVVRKAYDVIAVRKRRPLADADPNGAPTAAAGTPATEDERLDLLEALRSLDADFRVVVVCCDVFGMSLVETAEALGIAEGTVKSRRSRGLSRIAATLQATNPL